jgi:competence protein ComEA
MIPTQTRRSYCSLAALTLFVSAWAALAQVAYSQQKSTATGNDTEAQSQAPVNVNTADAKTLATLPGVGPATAQHIIDGRPYHKLADLEKVKGLSASKVEALKGKVSFAQPKAHHEKTADATQTQDSTSSSTTAKHTASTSTGNAPTESTASSGSSSSHSGASAKLAPGEKININTASAEELDRLPGIGKTKAQAIVDYRNQNGSFKTLEDIEKVKGIKAGSFEKMKDYIKLSN